MSFREINAWIGLASILVVFGCYFARVGAALRAGPVKPGDFLDQFIGSVVLLVVLQIALSIVAAIATGASQAQQLMRDERERTIELEASRIALPLVQLGAVMAAGAIALGAPPAVTAHGLVLMLVLGEVVRLGGQILYFHRGV